MKNCDNTKGKITITTNKASVLNATQINSKFIAIDNKYIKKGNLLTLEGWYRTYLLFVESGLSDRKFGEYAEKKTTWSAATIANRIGMIRWALDNIKPEGKKAVMALNGDKFVTVVDSMEQIVVTRYPKQHSTVKAHEKKARVVSVKTIDEKECRKRLRSVVINGRKLDKSEIDSIVFAIMQEEVK